MLGDDAVKALLAVGGDAGADRSLQLNDVARFLANGFCQPLAGDRAFVNAVGGHSGEIELLARRIDIAVEQHHGDLGFLGLLQHRVPTG